jgi:hypothetical protein
LVEPGFLDIPRQISPGRERRASKHSREIRIRVFHGVPRLPAAAAEPRLQWNEVAAELFLMSERMSRRRRISALRRA